MGIGLGVTINETSDGRRIVHYDGQSYELTSSSGEVICPASDGTALHHSRTCGHMIGYEDDWKVYPDPDGDLWQRLLESAPADDARGRQAFAEGAGLRNGVGRPVSKICQTCTLVPLTGVGGFTTPPKPLSKALAEFDAIDSVRPGPALTAKAISCYFPGALLPITSRDHVRAFIFHLSGESAHLDAFAAHERLKQIVDGDERFAGWHPYEVGRFLYEWADPPPGTTTILKVAPGENARYWDECLADGYICIGWEDVGDLAEFGSEEEFRVAFEEAYFATYKGNKSKISAKANELWRFYQLKPGDLVVANKGIREVLAVGTVTDEAYRWRDERTVFQHTVSVNWDLGYAQTLAEPQTSWGTVTVAKVQPELWKSLRQTAPIGRPERETVRRAALPARAAVAEAARRRVEPA